MLILQVNIHVKPEYLDAFRAATIENASHSLQEPGIARFDFIQHSDDPNRFCLWEVYHTEEAVAAHKLTAHWALWTERVADMVAEPRTRTWYKTVYPGDETW
jgi:(4S)-4-hydroxy-5-phosphonooxypentane-2,3-dione isomerase